MAVTEITHWINGAEDAGSGSRRQEVYNPATGQVTGSLHLADSNDLEKAVQAARKAADAWSEVSMSKRMQVMFKFRELVHAHTQDLAALITAEHGKVLSDAAGEVGRGLEVVEFACALPQTLKGEYSDQFSTGIDVYSFRQPLGVVAGITPFNFPVMVPLWMSPIAIATGNAFILKPSERDPSASLLLAKLYKEAGLPDGVFQVLHGDKETVDGLLTHEQIDGISFVGSTPVAQHIHQTATAHGKRVQALGGAKNHAVVMPDADLDLAADHLSAAAFGSAGERCMAISVAVAVGEAADDLVQKLGQRARDIKVGEGTQPDVEMGPLITPASRERVQRIVTEAEQDGAAVVVDGRDLVVEGKEEGFFVGPTVLDKVKEEMSAYQEEIFGPVLAVVRVDSLEDAIKVINSNPYGNGTAIFTGSGNAARTFKRQVTVGMVGVNVPIPVPAAQHSFGGWKDSLFGDHHIYGPDGVRFYTRGKVITERWPHQNDVVTASMNFPSHD
ncbi:CoA-acylating methylmalonate-semialdehyde dehydrogenase [Nesterenkonia alkaliphila]|uniref:methylmalonate-semialdehyde dehydrogenase (CoA acylating) n=1 Tax=Nesterenkonia alkaliphila TaxID=1463631 RepID=A0A7K1UEN7_9MICC|nr:CoA-acylating methylmalonate-semialdehyde dehydrogenase [Nesterenkonia alkaliphila]MVT24947.1 CoA-acylating methylmalonate-semialdehyde dehydrogenase [Nesterenkonia alkaliphila]GFZ86886.1 methylmalonate-semialdehyde dehydrogenase (acylating) [Nesterenkonia alkaliphila]